MIPKVLVVYHHRPMSAGLFYPPAFRQAGCQVRTAGPGTPHVYGRSSGQDHVFEDDDYVPPDFTIPNAPIDATTLVESVKAQGFTPDLLFVCDQYDPLVVTGTTPPGTKFAHLAVENWNQEQYGRYQSRKADAEYYQIAHSNEAPIPPEAEWVVFGADASIHPNLGLVRDKWVCQIGTAYEPRPDVWNALRAILDNAPPISKAGYLDGLHETEHTLFGRTPSYRGLAMAYNRSLCALSCSNSDFIPMRIAEAMGMGCALLSDDVPAMRAAFGAPAEIRNGAVVSQGQGYWIANDRTPLQIAEQVLFLANNEWALRGVTTSALALVHRQYTYAHTARRVLDKVGLQGATRLVVS